MLVAEVQRVVEVVEAFGAQVVEVERVVEVVEAFGELLVEVVVEAEGAV